MTDEELCKKLRKYEDDLLHITADRIEALELALTQSRAETAAAYELAAKLLDQRGQEEQINYGLGRETQNFYRARDMVRALATTDQTAALDAVRAEARAQVTVKPLVWFEVERGTNGYGKWTAQGYTVRKIEGLFLLDFAGEGKSTWRFLTSDAAKAAAQADYDARILAAIKGAKA